MTLERMRAEAERLQGKVENYQQRLRKLARKIVEAENAEIVALVRTLNVSPGELPSLLERLRAGGMNDDSLAFTTDPMETEETHDETEE